MYREFGNRTEIQAVTISCRWLNNAVCIEIRTGNIVLRK